MAVTAENKEFAQLKNLIPLNTLEEENLLKLLASVDIDAVAKGSTLFSEGDVDHVNVYLLSGKVGLFNGATQVDLAEEGSATARFPVAHQLPRKFTAKALTNLSIVKIDSRLLSEALAEHESSGQQVQEVSFEDNDDDWMSQLLQSRVMQNIPAANLQGVMMRMQEHPVETGDMIITEGEEGDFYYLLHRGQAIVLKHNEVTGEQVEVVKLGPGASFGEDALLSDSPRSSSIKMLTDGIVLRLAKEDFIELVQHPLSETVNYQEATAIIDQGGIWLDVRSPEKFELAHLPNAINMPYPTLRFQIPSLSDEHHYVIVSQSGRRGIASGFLFIERGFHVSILDGGYDKLPEGIIDMPAVESESEEAPATVPASPPEPDVSTTAAPQAAAPVADSGQLNALNEKIKSLEAQLHEKDQQLEAYNKQVAELETALAAKPDATAEGAASDGATSGGDLEALKKELVQLEREVITLTGQLESEEEGYDKLKQQFDTLSADHKKHLQVRDTDIARLKEELTVLQLEKDQAESDYEELEKQMQQTPGNAEAGGGDESLQQALNQVSQLEGLNASITKDRDDMRNDLEEARNQLSLAKQENSELHLEISELKGRISELTE